MTLLAVCLLGAACGDPFEPILSPIPDARETVLIDFEDGDLIDPAAYDMFTGNPVRTDQTNGWDFLFVVDDTRGPALIPRAAILGETTTAGLQHDDRAFAVIARAPEGGYTVDELVPVEVGDVLTMVSRRNPQTSIRCRVFGKLEVLSIEGTPASLRLRAVVNPNCERRELIEEDED